jgi:hypothetical protein
MPAQRPAARPGAQQQGTAAQRKAQGGVGRHAPGLRGGYRDVVLHEELVEPQVQRQYMAEQRQQADQRHGRARHHGQLPALLVRTQQADATQQKPERRVVLHRYQTGLNLYDCGQVPMPAQHHHQPQQCCGHAGKQCPGAGGRQVQGHGCFLVRLQQG